MIDAIYADGGVMGHNPSTMGGSWAWCWVTPDGKVTNQASGLLIPTPKLPYVTNNYAEYVAVLRALRSLPANHPITVYSDSMITLGRFFLGWSTEGIPIEITDLALRAIERLGRSNIKHVLLKGHPTQAELGTGVTTDGRPVSYFNKWCDDECTSIMRHYMAQVHRIQGKEAPQVTSEADEDAEVRF